VININQNLKGQSVILNEHALQAQCVRWFRFQYPYPKFVIAAVPNAAKRSMAVAMMMKAEGMLKGFPDLVVPHSRHGYHHLYIEMKRPKQLKTTHGKYVAGGTLSPEQKEVHEILIREGNLVKVCDSFETFQELVSFYLK